MDGSVPLVVWNKAATWNRRPEYGDAILPAFVPDKH
jgi:hypothetical protein